jgi:hypothetical protein
VDSSEEAAEVGALTTSLNIVGVAPVRRVEPKKAGANSGAKRGVKPEIFTLEGSL